MKSLSSTNGQSVHSRMTKKVLEASKSLQIEGWILIWFFATAIICTWDASFIMLRPYSLPGGSLAFIWYLYKYYIPVDQRYNDIQDDYVFAQSLLNYVEVIINIVTIVLHYKKSRYTRITAFTVSVMTFWKTVLYFLMFSEFCAGDTYRKGNTAWDEFLLVVIPNGVWIVVPFSIMCSLWYKMIPETQGCLPQQDAADGRIKESTPVEHTKDKKSK